MREFLRNSRATEQISDSLFTTATSTSELPSVSFDSKVFAHLFAPLFKFFHLTSSFLYLFFIQMTDSYTSSRLGDVSPSTNGHANGSSTPLGTNAGVSSVIRKKLMGYVGFANLPNQVHRKSVRKGFQFTAMVVGMCLHTTYFFKFRLLNLA